MHGNVVRLDGQGGQFLKVETDAELVGVGELSQERVVIALAASESIPSAVERHAGDDGDIYLVPRREGFAVGFEYTECAAH